METTLINLVDIRKVRYLSNNYQEEKLDAFVLEVQRRYLEPLLGVELYQDLFDSVTDQTSGSLVVGREYEITEYQTGDDFTNVGASENAAGERFIATGTTPTVWTNSSSLQYRPDNNQTLLNGEIYEVSGRKYNFRGVRLYVVYLFLHIYATQGKESLSEIGLQNYESVFSSGQSTALSSDLAVQFAKAFEELGEQTKHYLDNNESTFPLYKKTEATTDHNFTFDYKAIGNTYNKPRTIY